MGWYGKLIGGTLGSFIGGPFGAIIGAVIGHSFDKRAETGENSYSSGYYSGQRQGDTWGGGAGGFTADDQAQMVFFVATFSMLGKMAAADGRVTESEIRTIENFIDRDLRLGYQEKQFAMRIVQTAAVSSETFEKFARQFHDQFSSQPQILATMYDILLRVSAADNALSPEEERILDSAAKIFGLSGTGYEKHKTGYTGSASEKHYSVLGCTKNDSNDTIKAKYKKLVKDFHPDVIASKGLPEEFTKFASEKFREINQAYEEIRKERNF